MKSAEDIDDYQLAIKEFEKISDFKDSSELAEKCRESIIELDAIPKKCYPLMRELKIAYKNGTDIVQKRQAIDLLNFSNDELNSQAATISKLSQEITNCLNDIDSLKQKLSILQKEKENISFFAINRKKEISKYNKDLDNLEKNELKQERIIKELKQYDLGKQLFEMWQKLRDVKEGEEIDFGEYSCAVKPPIRQTGNRLSGLTETANASLLA